MAFKIGDTAYFVGNNEEGKVTDIRERVMAIFYQLDDKPVWIPERLLWNGMHSERIAFCSQLWCQRRLDISQLKEGVHYVKDEYGSPMCNAHIEEIATHGWNGYDPR